MHVISVMQAPLLAHQAPRLPSTRHPLEEAAVSTFFPG